MDAPSAGMYQVDTGSNFDTKINLFAGTGCSAICIEGDDDDGIGLDSLIRFNVANAGTPAPGGRLRRQLGQMILNVGPEKCSSPSSGRRARAERPRVPARAALDPRLLRRARHVPQLIPISLRRKRAGHQMLDVTLVGYELNVDFNLYDGSCTLLNTYAGNFQVPNNGAAAATYIFEAFAYPTNTQTCTQYELDVALVANPCVGVQDDNFEDNDSCAAASVIAPGSYTGLFASTTDLDFYKIDVPNGMILNVDLAGYTYDVDFDFYVGGCGVTPIFYADDFSYSNNTGATQTVIFEAISDPTNAQPCTVYDLNISMVPDPCAGPDDNFEDNDDCATATQVGDGTYTGLIILPTDNDYFTFCVPDGATVNVEIYFTDALADIDLFLREASSPYCGTGYNALNDMLGYGYSVTDNEIVAWTNNLGYDATLVAEVDWFSAGTHQCNTYDLFLNGTGCSGGSVTTFCDPMNVNSTGLPTVTVATLGSGVGSGLHLDSNQGPPSQFGYYLIGNTFAEPGLVVSNGRLCLGVGAGTAIGRYNVLGQMNSIGQFNASGVLQNFTGTSTTGTGFDVPAAMPFTGSPVIQSGETWHFQLWHRESGGFSNFSNGVSVTFP
ncbi:MAG: hypothetical protein R3E96_16650 [Planctomycetota bacterium]